MESGDVLGENYLELTQAEGDFQKWMNVLARLCEFELEPALIELYDKRLSPYSYERVNHALQDIIASRGTKEAFPSVVAIIEKMEPKGDDKYLGLEVANLLLKSVSKKGRIWLQSYGPHPTFKDAVIAELGEAAYHTMEAFGGWGTIVDSANIGKLDWLRSQLRDTAMSVMDRARNGTLGALPQLPMPENKFKSFPNFDVKKLQSGDRDDEDE